MKKIILSIAVLTAFTITSCKKAYECTCETTYTQNTVATMSEYNQDAADENEAYAEYTKFTDKTVITMDKTSKAEANAACADSENKEITYYQDNSDEDNDGNDLEEAGTYTYTAKTDCSLEKK